MPTNLVNFRQEYARYTRYFQEIKKIYQEREEVRDSVELLLTLLTISFFVIFAIRPTVNTIAELLATIRSQEEVSEQLDQKIESLSRAKSVFTEAQDGIALLDEGLTQKPYPEKYLRQIEGLAANTNVNLDALTLGNAVLIGKSDVLQNTDNSKVAGTNSLRVSFSVNGDYASVYSFLRKLENLRLLVTIDSFSFGPSGSSGNKSFALNFSGHFPYYEEKK